MLLTLEIKTPELGTAVLRDVKNDVKMLRERLESYTNGNKVNVDNLNGRDEKLAFELRRELMRLRTEALAFVQGLDGVYENFETLR